MGQRERKSEMERERKWEEAGKEQREYLKFFVFFFLSRCEVALVVLQAGTTSCAHAISKGLVAQAY